MLHVLCCWQSWPHNPVEQSCPVSCSWPYVICMESVMVGVVWNRWKCFKRALLLLPVGYDMSFIGHPLHSYWKCGGQSLMMVGPLRNMFGRIYAWKYRSCWYNHFACCLYIGFLCTTYKQWEQNPLYNIYVCCSIYVHICRNKLCTKVRDCLYIKYLDITLPSLWNVQDMKR